MAATDGRSVLSGATRYLFQSILLIRDTDLPAPTPCQAWDLRRLLGHIRASLQQLTDLLAVRGAVTDVETDAGSRLETNPVAALRIAIADLLLAATLPPAAGRWCEIGEQILPAGTVVDVAAIEMVLHAWDIAQACNTQHPVPTQIASALLGVAPPLAEAGLAQHLFAEPVEVPSDATPSDHLLALFGRRPLEQAASS